MMKWKVCCSFKQHKQNILYTYSININTCTPRLKSVVHFLKLHQGECIRNKEYEGRNKMVNLVFIIASIKYVYTESTFSGTAVVLQSHIM